MLGPGEERYVGEVAHRLLGVLGEDLVAAYLIGSGAHGDWVRGRSDLDVMAICARPVSAATKRRVVASLRQRALPCPARCLELVVYRRDAMRAPGSEVDFELNLNTGADIDDHVSFDPREEPSHWFIIDLAIARNHARSLVGPPPQQVIGRTARAHVLAALAESLRWHEEHESTDANGVFNACRAWRYAVEGIWSPKGEAARWALEQGADRALIGRALALREGARGELDGTAVRALLARVRSALGDPRAERLGGREHAARRPGD
jgi:hypothetical protein